MTSEVNLNNKTIFLQDTKSVSSGNLSTFGAVRSYKTRSVCLESTTDTRNALPSNKNVLPRNGCCSCNSEHVCHNYFNKESTRPIKSKPLMSKQIKQEFTSKSSQDKPPTLSKGVSAAKVEEKKNETYNIKLMTKKKQETAQNKTDLKVMEEKRLVQKSENFRKWLLNKNKEKEKEKLEKQKSLEIEKEKATTKELRNMESHIRYQLWLKRKEEEELEKELRAKLIIEELSENKDNHTKINKRTSSSSSWLGSSEAKQGPLPRGKEF